jgi:hypothetical protein
MGNQKVCPSICSFHATRKSARNARICAPQHTALLHFHQRQRL